MSIAKAFFIILLALRGRFENCLKPSKDTYKASLKSTMNFDKQFSRSLASDKNKTLLLYNIGLCPCSG